MTILAIAGGILAPSSSARCTQEVRAKDVAAFQSKVWAPSRWRRGEPPHKTKLRHRRNVACAAGPGHRKAIRRGWQERRAAFYVRRRAMLWRERVTPYYCDGTWWATECTIPLHESGYGSGGDNLYGMLDAWALHGCTAFAPTAWEATKREQDICASRHWADYGRGGWPSY